MASAPMTKDKMTGDALFILKSLKENARLGRSNKLADVKLVLENSVALEFDSYFFFLRKFHYIAMDREAQLKLTEQGERVVDGEHVVRFTGEVAEFFADQIPVDEPTENRAPVAALSLTTLATPETVVPEAIPVPLPVPVQIPAPVPAPVPRASRRSGVEEAPAAAHGPAPHAANPHPTVPEPKTPSQVLLAPPPPPPPPSSSGPLPLTAAMVSSPSQVGLVKGSPPQDTDARYQRGDQLGSGPLGIVYRGRHVALGIDVCVKELKDIFGYFSFLQRGEVTKRMRRELCAQAQLRHPGVVQLFDQNTDAQRPSYVMELCRGSLKERLDAGGGKGVPVPLAMRYFLQLAYALRAAHQQGLTHHNIKPENVLFDACGNAKLSDFGLSRVIEVDAAKGMPQVFVGTGGMAYLSPELMARSKDAGAAADVYGLGILLYEMLTGQLPGRRSPLPSELNADCPAAVDPIFDRMTHDRRESRYADFDAVLDDFYVAFGDKTYLSKGDLILWGDGGRA